MQRGSDSKLGEETETVPNPEPPDFKTAYNLLPSLSSFPSQQLVIMSDAAPPAEKKGLTLTAAKMYPPFKLELDSAIHAIHSAGGQLKLVGILGTGKEDAKMYAEVRRSLSHTFGIFAWLVGRDD